MSIAQIHAYFIWQQQSRNDKGLDGEKERGRIRHKKYKNTKK